MIVMDGDTSGRASIQLRDTPRVSVLRAHNQQDMTAEHLRERATDAGAEVVLLGEHTDRPGARAVDYLTGVTTNLPVATPAVPYIPGADGTSRAEQNAYMHLADALFR